MGSKLDTKQMEVLSFNIWAGGAGEKWRRRVEQRSAASGGAHPKQQLGGVVINSIFLITRLVSHPKQQLGGVVINSIFLITRWSSMEVPLPSGRQQVSCTWLTRRPRPSGSGGSPVDPARKSFAEHQGDKRVSRRSSGALEARRGSAEGF